MGFVLADKYRVLKPLGKGGEGSVWLSLHLQTEQLWAVKEIRKKKDGQGFRELNMMKKLHHPSLPKVVDVCEDEDFVYLIMEYVRGCTLEELLQRQKRFSTEQVLEVGSQIGHALCYLHGRTVPVFHLDIKPANIIWRRDGRLMLVDFGAAWKQLPEEAGFGEMEDSGEENSEFPRRGTDGFAAPEQYDPKRCVDGRSDIYGLGATLYCLISGVRYSRTLFKSRIPGCPDCLAAIIKNCIQEEPSLRYQNSRLLCRAITKCRKQNKNEKQRYRFWMALLLAVLAVGLAVHEIPREFAAGAKTEWNYEQLLSEAACAGGEERREYYERALFVCPERKEAYLQYLRQAEADGCFSRQEEEVIRTWLHTIPLGQRETYEELLEGRPEHYGELASNLGMIYWYDYEGEDGKQIAAGWFEKAVAAGRQMREKSDSGRHQGSDRASDWANDFEGAPEVSKESKEKPDWLMRAELYAHMGSYYGRLGNEDENGEVESSVQKYWNDLRQLLELDFSEYENPVTVLRFCEEAMNQIVFQTEEIHRAGASKDEILEQVERIVQKAEIWTGEAADESITGNGTAGGEATDKSITDSGKQGRDRLRALAEKVIAGAETAREVAGHLEMNGENGGLE